MRRGGLFREREPSARHGKACHVTAVALRCVVYGCAALSNCRVPRLAPLLFSSLSALLFSSLLCSRVIHISPRSRQQASSRQEGDMRRPSAMLVFDPMLLLISDSHIASRQLCLCLRDYESNLCLYSRLTSQRRGGGRESSQSSEGSHLSSIPIRIQSQFQTDPLDPNRLRVYCTLLNSYISRSLSLSRCSLLSAHGLHVSLLCSALRYVLFCAILFCLLFAILSTPLHSAVHSSVHTPLHSSFLHSSLFIRLASSREDQHNEHCTKHYLYYNLLTTLLCCTDVFSALFLFYSYTVLFYVAFLFCCVLVLTCVPVLYFALVPSTRMRGTSRRVRYDFQQIS